MSPILFRIWLHRTLLFAAPLVVIGIWDRAEEGFMAFAACGSALALVSAATYASFLILRAILDSKHPALNCRGASHETTPFGQELLAILEKVRITIGVAQASAFEQSQATSASPRH